MIAVLPSMIHPQTAVLGRAGGARLGIALLKAAIGVLNQVIMSVILRKQKNNSCVSTRVSYDTRSLSIRQEFFFFCKDTTKRSVWLLIVY